MSKIGKALVRGATARLTAQLIASLIGLALLPFIFRSLGDRLFGAWVLVGTMVGYYGLLDLGLASAVSRFVSREIGRGDKEEANRYIAAAFYVFCVCGFVILLLGILASYLCGLFLDDPADVRMFRYSILILGISLAIMFPSRCFRGILRAHLRFDLLSIMSIIFTLIRAGLTIAVLLCGGKVVGLVLAGASVNLLRTACAVSLARWVHGPISFRPSYVKRDRLRTLLGYAFFSFITHVSTVLRIRIIPCVITGYLGLAAIGPYAFAGRIRRIAKRVCVSVLATMKPVFSQMEGRNEAESIRWSYFFVYKIACYLGTFLIGMIAICGADFVERWIPELENVVILLYIGLVGTYCTAIQIPTKNLLFGVSRNKFFAIGNIIQFIITIVLSFILIKPFGLIGVIAAVSSSVFLVKMFVQAWWVCRFLKISLLRYHFCYTLPYVLKPALFLAVVFLISREFLAPTYLRLAITGLGASILFVPYIFFAGFDKKERSKFLEAVGLAKS